MESPPPSSDRPALTVICCSLNRRESLARCLRALAEQAAISRVEVLVVDNGSDDGTGEMVAGLVTGYPTRLRLVPEPRRGLSIARNTALEEASAPDVVFIDDDVTFAETWLDGLLRAFADPGVDAVGGPVQPVFPEGTEPWFAEEAVRRRDPTTSMLDLGDAAFDFDPLGDKAPVGCNMAIRRDLARELGGFREDLGWGKEHVPGEETNLFGRLLRRGGRVRYEPQARVYHHLDIDRVNVAYARRWHFGYGRASIRMKGREAAPKRAARFLDQAMTYGFYSLLWLGPGGRRNLRILKRRYQALGRMAEIAGVK